MEIIIVVIAALLLLSRVLCKDAQDGDKHPMPGGDDSHKGMYK